ncbi:MAG: phosphatase PAP2 family protein, partial [Acidobacteriaceae bacterium]
MKRPLSLDDWLCLGILLGLTVLVGLDRAADSFFYATSAATAVMAFAAVQRPELRREFFLLGFLLPISLIATTAANHVVVHLSRHTLDAQMLKLDGGFSAAIYHWVLRHRYPHLVLNTVYYGLPLFSAFVLCVSPRRFEFARAWIVAAAPAPLFFLAFPATGPAHAADPMALRNCIPSLHLTWALLGVVYIAPRWRWSAIVFAALTATATLGIGEHYLIDLIVA